MSPFGGGGMGPRRDRSVFGGGPKPMPEQAPPRMPPGRAMAPGRGGPGPGIGGAGTPGAANRPVPMAEGGMAGAEEGGDIENMGVFTCPKCGVTTPLQLTPMGGDEEEVAEEPPMGAPPPGGPPPGGPPPGGGM